MPGPETSSGEQKVRYGKVTKKSGARVSQSPAFQGATRPPRRGNCASAHKADKDASGVPWLPGTRPMEMRCDETIACPAARRGGPWLVAAGLGGTRMVLNVVRRSWFSVMHRTSELTNPCRTQSQNTSFIHSSVEPHASIKKILCSLYACVVLRGELPSCAFEIRHVLSCGKEAAMRVTSRLTSSTFNITHHRPIQ